MRIIFFNSSNILKILVIYNWTYLQLTLPRLRQSYAETSLKNKKISMKTLEQKMTHK